MGIDFAFHGPDSTQAEIDATTIAAQRARIRQLEDAQARIPDMTERHRQELARVEQRAHRAERELQS